MDKKMPITVVRELAKKPIMTAVLGQFVGSAVIGASSVAVPVTIDGTERFVRVDVTLLNDKDTFKKDGSVNTKAFDFADAVASYKAEADLANAIAELKKSK